jgi:5-methylcytosine-specific restriction endonuclease McrA
MSSVLPVVGSGGRPKRDPEKRRAYNREYYLANADRMRARAQAWREANPEKAPTPERMRAYRHAWLEANPEKNRASKRDYQRRQREADPEAERARQQLWREANPDKLRAYAEAGREKKRASERARRQANPEKARAKLKAWKDANPEKVAAYSARGYRRRRARKAAVRSERWTPLEVFERDGWQCQVDDCRSPTGRAIDPAVSARTRWGGVVDHIRPISKGGHDTLDNLQAAHRACNSAKGTHCDDSALTSAFSVTAAPGGPPSCRLM